MESVELENIQVSFYKSVWGEKYKDLSLGRVLHGIRICAYGNEVNAARACLFNGNKVGYDKIKSGLPAVTFCGTFAKGHKADECTHYNNILVIDIDKLDEFQFESTRECLMQDPYVVAFWVSPSGKGFKGLVMLKYSNDLMELNLKDRHKAAFRSFFAYLLANYNIELDASGKDICRLCYMSADKNIVVKEQAELFFVKAETPKEDSCEKTTKDSKKTTVIKTVDPKSWNEIYGKATNYAYNGQNRSVLTYIYKKLRKKNVSITDTWENWVKVAFSIASSVHPVIGRKIFMDFCQLDGARHDEAKSEHLIWDAYSKNQGKCSLNTIIYLARQKGVVLDR